MITGENFFQIWAQDYNTFRMIWKKKTSKMASKKVKICPKKKKPTPSTNNPLLSYQKSEQQHKKIKLKENHPPHAIYSTKQ